MAAPAVATEPVTSTRDCSPRAVTQYVAPTNDEPDTAVYELPKFDSSAFVQHSVEMSRALYDCAHEIGLAYADDPEAIVTLAAREIRGPLLLIESWSAAHPSTEIQRLAPERIVAAGITQQQLHQHLSGLDLADFDADIDIEWVPVDPSAVPPPRSASADIVWIVESAERAAMLESVGAQVNATAVVVARDQDLRTLPESDRNTLRDATQILIEEHLALDAQWQLEVVQRGEELPGGGLVMFGPGRDRRLVAMYGHPSTGQLGVLGEQDPVAGVQRLRSIAQGYGADGSDIVLAFEVIATVASAQAGADGDYSNMTAHDAIWPWIDAAAANDMYVVLDLQPGRTDFLTQAKQYEELLRLPHVGLALDPEWRLRPAEVHLRQVGTVDAAEINQVVRWLAGLVREEALPQKLLIVHQFAFSMITNRNQIETPTELAVMIHMDGQGPIDTKYSTWQALTTQPDAHRFYWGWKNFYDEDFPTPTAEQVLALTPSPLFVSYQ